MAKVFVCHKSGGMETRADSDDGRVGPGHMKETHETEMGPDEILGMAQEVKDAKPWWKIW